MIKKYLNKFNQLFKDKSEDMKLPKTKKGIRTKAKELQDRMLKHESKIDEIEAQLFKLRVKCKHEDVTQKREEREDGIDGLYVTHCPTCLITEYSVKPYPDIRIK